MILGSNDGSDGNSFGSMENDSHGPDGLQVKTGLKQFHQN